MCVVARSRSSAPRQVAEAAALVRERRPELKVELFIYCKSVVAVAMTMHL